MPTYQKMYETIYTDPSSLPDNEDEAINLVKNTKFAYITDESFLLQIQREDCDLRFIKEKFFPSYYGFVVGKNWKYKKEFDNM